MNLVSKVKKITALVDENDVVDVDVLNENSFDGFFIIKDLFHQYGRIFVVPSSLYQMTDRNDIIYNDVMSDAVEDALLQMESAYFPLSEEDISLVPNRDHLVPPVDFVASYQQN